MSRKICAVTTVEITQINFVIPAMKVLKQNGWDVTIVCDMSPEFISEYKGEFELINIPFIGVLVLKILYSCPLD